MTTAPGVQPSRRLATVERVLSDTQINEFAERGYTVVPQIVPGNILNKAARRIDEVVAADPPREDMCGSHFYFLDTKDEPDLIAVLTASRAFGLAEDLAGRGTLEIPRQVQIALNIPPYSLALADLTSTPRTPNRPTARSAARSPCWPES